MVTKAEFCRLAGIQPGTLDVWVEAGWICPRQTLQGWRLSNIDLARARFIRDLNGPMAINNEGIATILHLVDQIHGLRRALRGTTAIIQNVTIVPTGGPDRQRSRGEANEHGQWEK